MRRRQHHEEPENPDRWLVSYADFITLLFAFFVVMYALSSVNEGKYRILSDSLDAAFRGPPRSLRPIQVGMPARSSPDSLVDLSDLWRYRKLESLTPHPLIKDPPLDLMEKEITKALKDLIDKGVVEVRNNGQWLEVEINTSILFPSGSAKLSHEAMSVIASLADVLGGFPNRIQVEGFTDNVPISNKVYPSNWELSAARAAGVVRLLAKNDISPERLVAVGHGQNHPRAGNDTEEGRSQNRRVVLTIPGEQGALAARPMSETEYARGSPALKTE